jgi:ATP-binding cassette subfamily B protein
MWRTPAGVTEDDKLTRTETRTVLLRSIRMASKFKWWGIATAVLVTVSVVFTLAGPLLVRHGIDAGIRAKDAGALNAAVIGYFIVTVCAYVVGRIQYLTINRAGEGFLRTLRITVFDRLQRQSMAFYDREKAGVLVARMTADIDSLAELVQWGLLQFMAAGLLLILAMFLLVSLSWQLTLIALLVLPILVLSSIKFQRDSNRAYLEVRERVGANLSNLQESIAAVRVIQAYAREEEQIRRFEESNRDLYRSHMHSVRVSTWYFGVVEFSGIAATAHGGSRWMARASLFGHGGNCGGIRVASGYFVRPRATTVAVVQHSSVSGGSVTQAVWHHRRGARRRRGAWCRDASGRR